MQIQNVPVKAIRPDPSQPRKTFDPKKLGELVADIKRNGVHSAIRLRPDPEAPKRFVLVFGERRWRASVEAGLKSIPAIVGEYTDEQILELQIAENSQRVGVHPLEEADAYLRLHNRFGRSAEQIAEKVCKPLSHVYERLKLCDLGAEVRAALWDGRISLGVAKEIARGVPPALQAEALKEVVTLNACDPITSVADARRIIGEQYHLPLAKAPFPLDKAIGDIQSCQSCPKRTGAQRALFAHLTEDRCLDLECHAKKALAHFEQVKATTKGRVLSPAEVKKSFAGTRLMTNMGLTDVNQPFWVGDKEIEIDASRFPEEQRTIAQLPSGEIFTLVDTDAVLAIYDPPAAGAKKSKKEKEREVKDTKSRDWERAKKRAANLALLEEAIQIASTTDELTILRACMAEFAGDVALDELGYEGKTLEEIQHEIRAMSSRELTRFFVRALLTDLVSSSWECPSSEAFVRELRSHQ